MREAQESVLAEMRRWGYRFVVTPSLEKLDLLALGLGAEPRRRLFKFTDSDGSVLALVGEKTVPVARLVAGQMRTAPLPLRLCYAATVLSNQADGLAGQRETYQVGAELIGAGGSAADAEVIAMAVRCLDATGLGQYQVEVGHTEFFQGLLLELKLPDDLEAGVRRALAARDFVALQELLEKSPMRSAERELLLRFPDLRGGPEILEAARMMVGNRRSERALNDLGRVYELLGAHGLEEAVSLDLGAIRDFDYYTGIIFEAYSRDLGRQLVSGGRYDQLLERFGRPSPATGFVIHLDLVVEALSRRRPSRLPQLDVALAWSAPGLDTALRIAASLRLFGMRAVVDTAPRGLEPSRKWRDTVLARNLVHCPGGSRVGWLGADGKLRRLPVEQAVARLAGASVR